MIFLFHSELPRPRESGRESRATRSNLRGKGRTGRKGHPKERRWRAHKTMTAAPGGGAMPNREFALPKQWHWHNFGCARSRNMRKASLCRFFPRARRCSLWPVVTPSTTISQKRAKCVLPRARGASVQSVCVCVKHVLKHVGTGHRGAKRRACTECRAHLQPFFLGGCADHKMAPRDDGGHLSAQNTAGKTEKTDSMDIHMSRSTAIVCQSSGGLRAVGLCRRQALWIASSHRRPC